VRLLTEEEGIVLDRLSPLQILKQAVLDEIYERDGRPRIEAGDEGKFVVIDID
jgi:hypothetical protein